MISERDDVSETETNRCQIVRDHLVDRARHNGHDRLTDHFFLQVGVTNVSEATPFLGTKLSPRITSLGRPGILAL